MDLPIEMYKKYVERRKLDVDQLRQAIADGSVDVFKRIGHQIRGNAGSFGFDDLVALGSRMEGVQVETLASEGKAIVTTLSDWACSKEKEFASL